MENKTVKTLAIAALVVAVGGLTLGYAALSQVLTINTEAKVQSSKTSWNVKFVANAVADPEATGDAIKGTATLTDTTVTLNDVVLKAPGDTVTYLFDVTNAGQIDAKLSSIAMKNPTVTGIGETKEADETLVDGSYTYTITYADGNAIAAEDTLNAGETKNLKLVVTLKADTVNLPANDVTISGLGATLTYVQK